MFSKRHQPFQIFTLAFAAAMFFPRVLPEGTFADALTYTSIARNMAEGRGSFWTPFFSHSFWIPFDGNEFQFYGHPPLVMGLQALIFRLVGDHWFVEKAFCIVIWLVTLALIGRLWRVRATDPSLWWLSVLTWQMMPAVLWSYPNFMLDNTMGVFSLAAAWVILKALSPLKYTNISISQYLIIAGLLLHLAFLSKGPVGLYPLAMPFFYGLIFKKTLKQFVSQTAILTAVTFGSLALWGFYAPARTFWQHYFEIQIISSIGLTDQSIEFTWLNYFDVPIALALQLSVMSVLGLLVFSFKKGKKTTFFFEKKANQLAAFYAVVGLSGSLPMMISHKTDTFYLIPALPFFALSFAAWLEPTFLHWFEQFKISPSATRRAKQIVSTVAVGVGIYCLAQIGRVGREQELIHDIKILRGYIPPSAMVAASDSMMKHFVYHTYFQRYEKWELTALKDPRSRFFLDEKTSIARPTEVDSAQTVWHFRRVEMPDLQRFQLYERHDLQLKEGKEN